MVAVVYCSPVAITGMSWYWKSDLRLVDENETAWTVYEHSAAKKLEAAFQRGQKTMKLDDTYKIDFKEMIQHRHEVRTKSYSVGILSEIRFSSLFSGTNFYLLAP